jgi:hypothetical protein
MDKGCMVETRSLLKKKGVGLKNYGWLVSVDGVDRYVYKFAITD